MWIESELDVAVMYSEDTIRETAEFWSRKAGKRISDEDAREILVNISGFFSVLAEWDAVSQVDTMQTTAAEEGAETECE